MAAPNGTTFESDLGVASRGARAVWADSAGVHTAAATALGVWGAPSTIRNAPAGGNETHPEVELDPRGKAFATWFEDTSATEPTPLARTKPPGAAWSTAKQIGPPEPHIPTNYFTPINILRVGALGDAIVLISGCDTEVPPLDWTDCGSALSVYDGAGPVFTRVAVPRRGRVRRRVVFKLASFDQWSGPPRAARWSFGDGQRARGARVVHRYNRRGRFTVRLTQVDRRGNTTTSLHKIRIRR
jgi:hypothetical protein